MTAEEILLQFLETKLRIYLQFLKSCNLSIAVAKPYQNLCKIYCWKWTITNQYRIIPQIFIFHEWLFSSEYLRISEYLK